MLALITLVLNMSSCDEFCGDSYYCDNHLVCAISHDSYYCDSHLVCHITQEELQYDNMAMPIQTGGE